MASLRAYLASRAYSACRTYRAYRVQGVGFRNPKKDIHIMQGPRAVLICGCGGQNCRMIVCTGPLGCGPNAIPKWDP